MHCRGRPGSSVRMIVAGGGTGGHLFSGLAVVQEFRAQGADVHALFVGTASGIEARVLPARGERLRTLPARPLRGRGAAKRLVALASFARALAAAVRLVHEERPDVILGVGGYASAPVVAAGILTRVPVVVIEQNARPGFANRWLGRWARRVCVGFAEATGFFPEGRAVHTGNPVRRVHVPSRSDHAEFTLLVVGGSAGAHRLNLAVPEAIRVLGERTSGWHVIHQSGTAEEAAVRAAYGGLPVRVEVCSFIEDVGAAYGAADLVVCRAGAGSVAELTAFGKAAVLVPYPHAVDDHQRANAEVLVRAGAARMLLDHECGGETLAGELGELASDAGLRREMAAAACRLGRPDAAARVAAECTAAAEGLTNGAPRVETC